MLPVSTETTIRIISYLGFSWNDLRGRSKKPEIISMRILILHLLQAFYNLESNYCLIRCLLKNEISQPMFIVYIALHCSFITFSNLHWTELHWKNTEKSSMSIANDFGVNLLLVNYQKNYQNFQLFLRCYPKLEFYPFIEVLKV